MKCSDKNLIIKTNIKLNPCPKITVSPKLKISFRKDIAKPVPVASARHVGGHRLEVVFTDGFQRTIDFNPFLKRFDHPDYDRYKKISEFKKFKIIDGNINWHDDNMIFEPESLYKGEIR